MPGCEGYAGNLDDFVHRPHSQRNETPPVLLGRGRFRVSGSERLVVEPVGGVDVVVVVDAVVRTDRGSGGRLSGDGQAQDGGGHARCDQGGKAELLHFETPSWVVVGALMV